jgi:hypothetical protein
MRARPLRSVAFVLLAVLCIGAGSQVSTIPLTVDLGNVLAKIAYGAAGLVGTGLLWLAKQGLDTLKQLDSKVSGAAQKITKIDHELFGPLGTNGMRGDVRDAKRELKRHSRVLAVLADREGIPFHEDEE